MGLYYQAILSSLLLNFLPDLPTTSFFTPQSPILFFSLWLLLFSPCFLPHYRRFQQVKKKIDFFAFVRATFFILFFFTQKVPIFCEDCRPELTEAYHNPKDGDLDTELPKREATKKWGPLNLHCGSSDSCFQLTMAHGMPTPHQPLTSQTHRNLNPVTQK